LPRPAGRGRSSQEPSGSGAVVLSVDGHLSGRNLRPREEAHPAGYKPPTQALQGWEPKGRSCRGEAGRLRAISGNLILKGARGGVTEAADPRRPVRGPLAEGLECGPGHRRTRRGRASDGRGPTNPSPRRRGRRGPRSSRPFIWATGVCRAGRQWPSFWAGTHGGGRRAGTQGPTATWGAAVRLTHTQGGCLRQFFHHSYVAEAILEHGFRKAVGKFLTTGLRTGG
jgi:hypothetical protein